MDRTVPSDINQSPAIQSYVCFKMVLRFERGLPAFSFTAESGPYLPTPEGWKNELAWVAGYIPRLMSGTGN